MKMRQSVVLLLVIMCFISCVTAPKTGLEWENERFLNGPWTKGQDKETFRVLIMSDRYEVVQMDSLDTIERVKDPGGDRYICDELKKFDKIDEAREGMYHISLFPDRGTLMKVRPSRPLNLIELDKLVVDDLQRWSFKFPARVIRPTSMYIKYRIVLRERESQDKVLNDIEKKMKGEE